MKRLGVILFSVFYLSITIGIAINVHYCHGEIASIQLSAEQETCCCGGESDAGCCRDDSHILKFENDQTIVSDYRVSLEQPIIDLLQLTQNFTIEITEEKSQQYSENNNSPPPQPIWLLNCSFVFYG